MRLSRTARLGGLVAGVAVVLGATLVATFGLGGDDGNAPGTVVMARIGDLEVTGARVTSTVNDVAALYFQVKNNGDTADHLLSATVDPAVASSATLHTTVSRGNTSSMEALDGPEVPAHGELVFTPGANHVMLEGVQHELSPGQQVRVSLIFQTAGTVTFQVPVVRPGG